MHICGIHSLANWLWIFCDSTVQRMINDGARAPAGPGIAPRLTLCHCQITAKSNSLRLSCSDLKIENLVAVRHFGFDRKWIFTISRPPHARSITHQCTNFLQNPTIRGWVIDDWTNCTSPLYCIGEILSGLVLGGQIYTKVRKITHSLLV